MMPNTALELADRAVRDTERNLQRAISRSARNQTIVLRAERFRQAVQAYREAVLLWLKASGVQQNLAHSVASKRQRPQHAVECRRAGRAPHSLG